MFKLNVNLIKYAIFGLCCNSSRMRYQDFVSKVRGFNIHHPFRHPYWIIKFLIDSDSYNIGGLIIQPPLLACKILTKLYFCFILFPLKRVAKEIFKYFSRQNTQTPIFMDPNTR